MGGTACPLAWGSQNSPLFPHALLYVREFPATIPGSIKRCRCSRFLSLMYLASALGFATSSNAYKVSALSSCHFCFSINWMTLAL